MNFVFGFKHYFIDFFKSLIIIINFSVSSNWSWYCLWTKYNRLNVWSKWTGCQEYIIWSMFLDYLSSLEFIFFLLFSRTYFFRPRHFSVSICIAFESSRNVSAVSEWWSSPSNSPTKGFTFVLLDMSLPSNLEMPISIEYLQFTKKHIRVYYIYF